MIINLKAFIKANLANIFIIIFCLATFGILFLLLNLDIQIFIYASSFILFFLFIYFIIKFLNFKDEVSIKEQLIDANMKIKQLENEILQERKNIEEYFLMWVHQMKTPITAASLLANDNESNAQERCRKIRQELIRIDDYSNMALNYLKLINPSTDLNFENIALDDIVKGLLKRYSVLFIYNHISLNYKPIKNKVLTDPKWMGIVIEQLLTNSIKYAKGEKITIEFDEKSNKLIISDTGIGIREEDIPKIFDKGFSGFNGKLNQKSTGLGLFLVKIINERLNQSIIVDSTLSKGTSFSIGFNKSNLSKL